MAERKKHISSLEEDPDEITVLESEDIDCESETENCTSDIRVEKKSQSLRKKLGLKLNLSSSSPKKEKRDKNRHEESTKYNKNGTIKPQKRSRFWIFRSKSKDDAGSRRPCRHTNCSSPCCSRSRSFRERLRRRTSRENSLDHGDYGHLTCPTCRLNHQHHHNLDNHTSGTSEVFTAKKKRMIHAIDLENFNPDDYPTTDIDEKMRRVRAKEMEEGVPVDLPSRPTLDTPVPPPARKSTPDAMNAQLDQLECSFSNGCVIRESVQKVDCQEPIESGSVISDSSVHMVGQYGCLTPNGSYAPRTVHTQIDYIHCLVPDLQTISSSSFYWGRMDRYEAERQLEGKPEGTFLLRDSAQEEFLFSVSFRRYGRSLHARIEQWNHKFSFDAHDPGVFSAITVCGLLEHYKDPNFCMFFEPMLTIPLPRRNPLMLQHLCRAVIYTYMRYDDIKLLCLPSSLREYLREYHYKQKVRVRRFEIDGPTEKEIY